MTCTPSGSPSSSQTGTATTGRPMNEIGCVNTPILARTGSVTPSRTKWVWPPFGARQGVVGARITSTPPNKSSTASRYQRRKRCARSTKGGREHRPGDQAVAHRRVEILRPGAQAVEMEGGALGRGDQVGRRPGAVRLPGISTVPRRAEGLGDARHRRERLRIAAAGEVAARHRDPQAADAGIQARQDRLRRPGRRHRVVRVGTLHRVVGEGEVGRRSGPSARDGRGCRRRGSCRPGSAGRRSASARSSRRRRRAPGSSRWCRSPSVSGTSPAAIAAPEPPGRAAGHVVEGVRVVGVAVVDVLAGEVVGVLAHVERADQDRARPPPGAAPGRRRARPAPARG